MNPKALGVLELQKLGFRVKFRVQGLGFRGLKTLKPSHLSEKSRVTPHCSAVADTLPLSWGVRSF